MSTKHAYISGAGPLVQTIEQLRKSFPSAVTSDTLKKLGLAPGNESFVINILKFLGLISEDGTRKPEVNAAFVKSNDEFPAAFEGFIRKAYADLFALHSDAAWSLSADKLIAYFRTSDESSELVGKRQAMTFQTLASLAGKMPSAKPQVVAPRAAMGTKGKPQKQSVQATSGGKSSAPANSGSSRTGSVTAQENVALTVRIEINLPAQGDQETYDRIFSSLRKNLLNA
jgi:Family of unknown function (DUF5343)